VGLLLTALTHSPTTSAEGWDLCSDCKKCEEFCPVGIPTGEIILKLKSKKGPRYWEWALSTLLRKKNLTDVGIKLLSKLQKPWQKGGRLQNIPLSWAKGKSLPPLKRGSKAEEAGKREGEKIYFFEGCLASLFFPQIREAIFSSLSSRGFHVVSPDDRVCCGAPSMHLGQEKDVIKLANINRLSFERENPAYILTICPTGNAMLKNTYPRLIPELALWKEKIFDFSEFVVNQGLLPEQKAEKKLGDIFYHYPCHYVNELGLREEPLKILRSLGYNPVVEEESLTCCGFSGVFAFKNPELSDHLWKKKGGEIKKTGATVIATDCPGCLFQIQANGKHGEESPAIYHTAELYAWHGKADSPKHENNKARENNCRISSK
jgi:Fe-S oxidoreductase